MDNKTQNLNMKNENLKNKQAKFPYLFTIPTILWCYTNPNYNIITMFDKMGFSSKQETHLQIINSESKIHNKEDIKEKIPNVINSTLLVQIRQLQNVASNSIAYQFKNFNPITDQMRQLQNVASNSVTYQFKNFNPITDQMRQLQKIASNFVAYQFKNFNPISEQILYLQKIASNSVAYQFKNFNPISEQIHQLQMSAKRVINFSNLNLPKPIDFRKLIFNTEIELSNSSRKIPSIIQEELDIESLSIDYDKISYFLEYDIYMPIKIMEKLPVTKEFSSQRDADKYLEKILTTLVENNITLFDLITLSNENINDVEKIENLFVKKYYKILCLYCFERIENIFHKIRFKYSEIDLLNNDYHSTVLNSTFDILHDTSDEDLKEIIENIMKNLINPKNKKIELNLYKRYSNNDEIKENIKNEIIPLNRNLFMHGVIDDKDIDHLLATKAILAYSFFSTLSLMKDQSKL
ncbi:hypothetical protein [Streptococcus parauberis]|uniref:hypothetical protein n=1 Tax=Streptococcus parauberis TaxID=1348 RepID=UPI0002BAB15E|nr:hypothetical protein [Streptococcus parauberis]EMF49137.1 hypothetical protein SPJ2_1456 [Streptococcus parauberis KRS-02109]UWM87082.1 hypothetical protein N2A93_00630 [Streptococcus parauberis]UWM89056.1 hypothetical protein N2A96_00630 [Streptococcus parauberis]WEM59795.1 hypothetical protein P1T47_00625 [Streptococcus parauberis]